VAAAGEVAVKTPAGALFAKANKCCRRKYNPPDKY